ncbi:pyridoxamine 5'-phosphate oxidase family protein [Brevibacillus humidisoli]|uniref:pyridoxamine 5'-phosphate oxidase family protein n=1 Tax=Brevibacillus humidisoli TaxID=2895522 RepID=UPI001E652AC1|nr:pyridoxamine 5'-phosphate oxidase family protein [Brevibacillus humidisoli]UFJ41395.1 pyridoxamine 5'-phosphate oxidase family protein [Brevibacillus humidisoli]
MSKPTNELSPQLIEALQGQTVVFVNVIEPESKKVYTSALSWVFATDDKTIRFAIDTKSEMVAILEKDPKITLSFIADESAYAVYGNATVKVRKTEDLTLKMALLEVAVEEVRNIMFYGGKIVQEPSFIKTYNADLAKKLDNEMKEALYAL